MFDSFYLQVENISELVQKERTQRIYSSWNPDYRYLKCLRMLHDSFKFNTNFAFFLDSFIPFSSHSWNFRSSTRFIFARKIFFVDIINNWDFSNQHLFYKMQCFQTTTGLVRRRSKRGWTGESTTFLLHQFFCWKFSIIWVNLIFIQSSMSISLNLSEVMSSLFCSGRWKKKSY